MSERVRSFNRFYTRQIGILQKGYLESRFSLAEVRVLYELAHREKPTATEIGTALGLDAGYLSRILFDFEKRGLIARRRSADDARQSYVTLTRKGKSAFARLDRKSHAEISVMLDNLTPPGRQNLVHSMHTIQQLLAPETYPKAPFTLRSHKPGDMGWINPPARRSLRAGIWMGRTLRGAGSGNRGEVYPELRSEARTLLDCRKRWGNCGIGLPR